MWDALLPPRLLVGGWQLLWALVVQVLWVALVALLVVLAVVLLVVVLAAQLVVLQVVCAGVLLRSYQLTTPSPAISPVWFGPRSGCCACMAVPTFIHKVLALSDMGCHGSLSVGSCIWYGAGLGARHIVCIDFATL